MRYFAILSIFFLFSFTKSSSDQNRILGMWSFYELKGPDGKMTYSADSAEQKKIADETVKEQGPAMEAAGYDEAKLREMLTKQFEAIGTTIFTFDDKGTVKTGSSLNGEQVSESTFTLDEKKKKITIKNMAGEGVTYVYSFKDDKLIMKRTQEEFTLQKK